MYCILGATGTIGAATARNLIELGHEVVLVGRSEEKVRALADELHSPCVVWDSRDSLTLENGIRQTLGDKTLEGIINCIGSVVLKSAHATSDDEFRSTIETNLFTSFAAVKVGAKFLRGNGGSIILFASAAAEIGIQNHEAIAAAKAGVVGLARSAAATYAANNIRVNVISPGLIKTELTRRIWEVPANESASKQLHALGRLGEVSHIVSLVRWLVSAENDWITGQVIGVDGGLGHVLARR